MRVTLEVAIPLRWVNGARSQTARWNGPRRATGSRWEVNAGAMAGFLSVIRDASYWLPPRFPGWDGMDGDFDRHS